MLNTCIASKKIYMGNTVLKKKDYRKLIKEYNNNALFVNDIFGFGSRALMISPIFLLVKIGCKETPIFELRSCSCLLVLSAALWLMKGIENITVGVLSLFLSASLCTLSLATLVINWFTVVSINCWFSHDVTKF